MECRDFRCTDGLTECEHCNGYGVLRRSGKRFTRRGGGTYITAASPACGHCKGIGEVICGCVDMDAGTVASMAVRLPVSVPA
jgi:DnaJ-class molecular chaperone